MAAGFSDIWGTLLWIALGIRGVLVEADCRPLLVWLVVPFKGMGPLISALVRILLLDVDLDRSEIPVSYPLMLFLDGSNVPPLLDACCCWD